MWKKLFDLAKLVFTFGEQTKKNQENLEVVQEEVRQPTNIVQRLAMEIQRIRDEIQHMKEMERQEREILMLRLENEMLKSKRALPPNQHQDE
jgi:hypothetical protein